MPYVSLSDHVEEMVTHLKEGGGGEVAAAAAAAAATSSPTMGQLASSVIANLALADSAQERLERILKLPSSSSGVAMEGMVSSGTSGSSNARNESEKLSLNVNEEDYMPPSGASLAASIFTSTQPLVRDSANPNFPSNAATLPHHTQSSSVTTSPLEDLLFSSASTDFGVDLRSSGSHVHFAFPPSGSDQVAPSLKATSPGGCNSPSFQPESIMPSPGLKLRFGATTSNSEVVFATPASSATAKGSTQHSQQHAPTIETETAGNTTECLNSTASNPEDCDLLKTLASNWPCVVSSILGQFPFSYTSNSMRKGPLEKSPKASSSGAKHHYSPVHLLDSFTTNLILNCEDAVIGTLVSTIVEKMNSSIESGADLSIVMGDSNLPELDFSRVGIEDARVALVVGARFLGSVVRVLALEHSRVKNAFLEMQQLRGGGGGDAREGGGAVAGETVVGGVASGSRRSGHGLKRKNLCETIQ